MALVRYMLVLVLALSLLGACGRRGPLQPAPGAEPYDPDPPFVLDEAIDAEDET